MTDSPRPDVLAIPSPTTSRFLVFIAALLAAGSFAGSWVHNAVVGQEWVDRLVTCSGEAQSRTTGISRPDVWFDRQAEENRCRGAVEYRRAAFTFGGAVAAGVGGLLVMLLAPRIVERRRRLRPLAERVGPAADRFGELAEAAGLARTPLPVMGTAALRDAFSYGVPGRYRIALPPAVAIRWGDDALFDPVVRHELAHVQRHDVALAWLARSMWWVLIPVLAAPVIAGLTFQQPTLIPDYSWRALLFAATVQIVSSTLLRSREHDADLRAARDDPAAIAGVIERVAGPERRSLRRRVLAKHPTRSERLAVLAAPERMVRVRFFDAFAAAFLAGLVAPVVPLSVSPALASSGHAAWATVAVALITGPLLAGSVGLGLFRAALVDRLVGIRTALVPAALGVAVGLLVGDWATFARAGSGPIGSLGPASWYLIAAALSGGATLVAAGLAQLLTDAAPAFHRARTAWLVAWTSMSLLFAAAIWLTTWLRETPRFADETLWTWVSALVESWLPITAAIAVAVTAVWCIVVSRRRGTTPIWLLERGSPTRWPTLRGSWAVGAAIVGLPLVAGVLVSGASAAQGDQPVGRPAGFEWAPEEEVRVYANVLLDFHERFQSTLSSPALAVSVAGPDPARAQRLRTTVLPEARLLRADAQVYAVRDARIQATHDSMLEMFALLVEVVEASAAEANTGKPGNTAVVDRLKAVYTRWLAQVEGLRAINHAGVGGVR